jgi:hypothetical protein
MQTELDRIHRLVSKASVEALQGDRLMASVTAAPRGGFVGQSEPLRRESASDRRGSRLAQEVPYTRSARRGARCASGRTLQRSIRDSRRHHRPRRGDDPRGRARDRCRDEGSRVIIRAANEDAFQ